MTEADQNLMYIFRYVAAGSTMHGDVLGVTVDQDELNSFRALVHNSLIDDFRDLPKDSNGHVKAADIKDRQKAMRGLFFRLIGAAIGTALGIGK